MGERSATSLGLGIVGAGFMGRTWSQVVTRQARGVHLVGVGGGTRAAQLARDYDVALMTEEEMRASPDVGAIILTTPPALHEAQGSAAARAGKHVFVEKPMTMTASEAERLVAVCRAADVRLGVVSQHRFRNVPRRVRDLIAGGAIGDVRMIRVMGPTAGYDAPNDDWKADPDQLKTFADWGAHACDILRWLVGADCTLVFAQHRSFQATPPPEQSGMAQFAFANGAIAQVWLTYEIPQPGLGSALQMLVTGSEGMIEFDAYGWIKLGKGDRWETVYEQPPFDPLDPYNPLRLEAYVLQVEDFATAIRDGREPAVDGREGLATMAMIDAEQRSADTGEAIRLRPT